VRTDLATANTKCRSSTIMGRIRGRIMLQFVSPRSCILSRPREVAGLLAPGRQGPKLKRRSVRQEGSPAGEQQEYPSHSPKTAVCGMSKERGGRTSRKERERR